MGYSPQSRKESDTTEATKHAHVCDNTQSLSSSFFFFLGHAMWHVRF